MAFGLVSGVQAEELPATFMQDGVYNHLLSLDADPATFDWKAPEAESPLCADNRFRLVIVSDHDEIIQHDSISNDDAQNEVSRFRTASAMLLDYSQAQAGDLPEVAAVYSIYNNEMKIAYPSSTGQELDCNAKGSIESISIDATSLTDIEDLPVDLESLTSDLHDFDPKNMVMHAIESLPSRPALVCLDTNADGGISIQELTNTDYAVNLYYYDSNQETVVTASFDNSADIYNAMNQSQVSWGMVTQQENNNLIAFFVKQDGQLLMNNTIPGFYGVTVAMKDENGDVIYDPVLNSDGETIINPLTGKEFQAPRMQESPSFRPFSCPTQGIR
jgi:hypothetical protein